MIKKRTVDLEAFKWHILLQLYHNDKPISAGQITSKLIGSPINYDNLYDSLFQLGLVCPIASGIQLTEKGRLYLEKELKEEQHRILHWITENEFELAVLDFLYHRPHLVRLEDFPELLVKSAPQQGNSIAYGNLLQAIHRMGAYVERPELYWFGITEAGRGYYEMKKGKLAGVKSGSTTTTTSEFSEQEKQAMNTRLNEILSKLEHISLENEVIWTDMKKDFEELRDLFHLGKKNVRQLLIGKLTEWTAGGVVSEIVSKQIVEMIKTTMGKLLS